jgi:large subunit ribosomal protein L24e
MVERRVCSFCGNEIEPGTGKIYVKIDGTIFNFCRNKCHKNLIELHRVPRRTRWTQPYMREKSVKMSAKEKKVSRKRKGKPTRIKKMKKKKPVEAKSESEEDKTKKKKRKKEE